MTDNLWNIPELSKIVTPLFLIREQAEQLTHGTKGLLRGEVEIIKTDLFLYQMNIVAPSLDHYSYEVFLYAQRFTELYPGNIIDRVFGKNIHVDNEIQLYEEMRRILSSEEIRRILAALLVQASEALKEQRNDP